MDVVFASSSMIAQQTWSCLLAGNQLVTVFMWQCSRVDCWPVVLPIFTCPLLLFFDETIPVWCNWPENKSWPSTRAQIAFRISNLILHLLIRLSLGIARWDCYHWLSSSPLPVSHNFRLMMKYYFRCCIGSRWGQRCEGMSHVWFWSKFSELHWRLNRNRYINRSAFMYQKSSTIELQWVIQHQCVLVILHIAKC